MGRTSRYLYRFLSFGLTTTSRINLFSDIHEIVFHSKGGYDWNTVYEMPIWLRKFTFNKLKEYYNNEQEAIDKQNNIITNTTNVSKKEIAKPDIPITYSTNINK